MTEQYQSKAKYLWIMLLVGVITIPIGLMFLLLSGQTSGQEFSPDDFSRRSFTYNQTPGLKWIIDKKVYTDRTTTLEESLVLDGFVTPVINTTKNWHLIQDSGSGSGQIPAQCDARFLTDYLDMTNDEGDNYWTQWNTDHPNTAKIFWPQVADLARHEMYLKIPEVMQAAMEVKTDDADEFAEELDDLIARAYLEMGQLDRELDRLNRARVRLARSIEIRPTDEAREQLSKCIAATESPAANQKVDE